MGPGGDSREVRDSGGTMPCPHHTDDESNRSADTTDTTTDGTDATEPRGLERREFVKSALAIGGTAALSTLVGSDEVTAAALSAGDHEPVSFAERANRQHAWDAYEYVAPEREQSLPPLHHLVLHVDYVGDGVPTPAEREQVAEAFREIERHFEWGHEGVLFTVGYSLSYFRRYDEPLPSGIDPAVEPTTKPGLLSPDALIESPGVTLARERPVERDTYDAVIHLASDDVSKLLVVEAALWDDLDPDRVWPDPDQGMTFDATLDGVFTRPESYPERRVGFAGHENVEHRLTTDTDVDGDRVPDADELADEVGNDHPAAELSMGFNDQYRNSIPRETNVTMLEDQQLVDPKPPGVFAQGTIQHVSKLDIDLAGFYDENDLEGRRARMFSPQHDDENTGAVGENLGNSNAPGDTPMRDTSADTDVARETEADWAETGVTGHAQKTARARFDMENRLTDAGRHRLSGDTREELLPAEERDDDLPGHDGTQESEGVLLRRDFVNTAPDAPGGTRTPGNHFIALMRFNPYMAYMRQAMNGVPFDSNAFGQTGNARIQHGETGATFDDGVLEDVSRDSGIAGYMETDRRGNYLVPPLTLRALPHPQGESVRITARRTPDRYEVVVPKAPELDRERIQFGWYYDVNRQRGATPESVERHGGSLHLAFDPQATGIETAPGGPDGDVRVRLLGFRADTGRPVRGTATMTEGQRRAPGTRQSGTDADEKREEAGNGPPKGTGRPN